MSHLKLVLNTWSLVRPHSICTSVSSLPHDELLVNIVLEELGCTSYFV